MPDISETPPINPKSGRRIDLCISWLAGFGAVLSLIAGIWFWLGFAENDTRPEQLVSATVLTMALFGLAIIPFGICAKLARQSYTRTGRRTDYIWALILMLPWVGVSLLALRFTPLPHFVAITLLALSSVISLWAALSLIRFKA